MDVDLFEYLYCYTCYHVTQISGSTPIKNCVCENKDCKKSNVEFGRSMSAKQKKDFLIQRELLKRNSNGKKV